MRSYFAVKIWQKLHHRTIVYFHDTYLRNIKSTVHILLAKRCNEIEPLLPFVLHELLSL